MSAKGGDSYWIASQLLAELYKLGVIEYIEFCDGVEACSRKYLGS